MIQIQTQPPALPTPAAAPNAPVLAGARTAPSAIYEGFRAQRRELSNQLSDLENTRREITSQLEDIPSGDPQRAPLEARMKEIDGRISSVDQMLAANSAQLSQAAAIPGAVVETPPPIRTGPPDEAYVLSGIFMVVVLLPLSIAFARRIWRRSAAVVTSLPREISERLQRMEQSVEATALEVERIGEGQRFLTRLFTEGEGVRVLGGGSAQPVQSKPLNTRDRLP